MLIKLAKEYFGLLNSGSEVKEAAPLLVPDDFFQSLLKYTFERRYLDDISSVKSFNGSFKDVHSIAWTKNNKASGASKQGG
jgi:hypothetical protein